MPLQISGVSMGVITGGPSSITLQDLANASIVSPVTGQYLRYNGIISEWQNAPINADVFEYLSTNLTSGNGVALTKTPGPNTINISLGLTASGDATGTVASGNLPLTLVTVNSNVGTFGSASAIPVITVNAKGLITSVNTSSISAATAISLSGGTTGSLPYQSAASATTFLAAGTTSQVLVGGASLPSWSNTPILTGTNFTGIPNAGLTNSSITVGSTTISLGASSATLAGLTSITAATFSGALSGNAGTATTLQTARTIATSGAATGTATSFNGSANITIPITALDAALLSAGTVPNGRLSGSYTGFTNITASGTITAATFNATSTKRVKKYIKDISKSTTDKFLRLRPREYDRKDYLAHEFGFIAEEMAEVYPEIVGTDSTGRATGIDYGKLSTILTAKVQEQQATIDELKNQMSYVMSMLKGAK